MTAHAAPEEAPRGSLSSALSFGVALATFAGLATTVVWALSGSGYYWPCWVWFGGAAALAPFACWIHAGAVTPVRRWLVLHLDLTAAVAVALVLIWLFAGAHGLWVLWTLWALAVPLALHALVHYRRLLSGPRARRLEERVQTLTRTRRDALDAQAAELRRIERDLHDGAQARLVALAMQLGRAEARLEENPEAAALVRSAREEATAAVAELRDLARGIAPPVLADRGLVAAAQSLAERSIPPPHVTISMDERRVPPAVESAAYFVIAEALTNVAKHAGGASAMLLLQRRDDVLLLEVSDEGPGGADPDGSGLRGLRARVEALDGTFALTSPAGGPTTIRAELPCGS